MKGKFDGVIAELIIALTVGGNPKSLSSLEGDLEQGASGLAKFCQSVSGLAPDNSGQKGPFTDFAKGLTEPVVKVLSEAVAAIYNNHRKDDALTIETIKTQLEATKWPDSAEGKAAE